MRRERQPPLKEEEGRRRSEPPSYREVEGTHFYAISFHSRRGMAAPPKEGRARKHHPRDLEANRSEERRESSTTQKDLPTTRPPTGTVLRKTGSQKGERPRHPKKAAPPRGGGGRHLRPKGGGEVAQHTISELQKQQIQNSFLDV